VTDQGSAFASDLLAALCKSLNTQHAFSVAHHPQSHGQVERLIKTVERSIAATAAQHQRDWDRHLAGIQATLNFSPNRTTGVAPFELLTGAAPLLPAEQAIAPDAHRVQHTINDLAKSVRDRTADVARKTASNVVAAQETQKRNHDERHLRPGPELDVGQYVLYEKPNVGEGLSRKIAPKWDGPYLIVRKLGNVNRRIQNVHNAANEFDVHVERLKPYEGPLPKPLPEDHFTIDEIMEEREKNGKTEYRVRWKGWTARHDTWEPEKNFTGEGRQLLDDFLKRPEAERRRPAEKKKRNKAAKPPKTTKKKNTQAGKEAIAEPTGDTYIEGGPTVKEKGRVYKAPEDDAQKRVRKPNPKYSASG
jgi:hypothetical protein